MKNFKEFHKYVNYENKENLIFNPDLNIIEDPLCLFQY